MPTSLRYVWIQVNNGCPLIPFSSPILSICINNWANSQFLMAFSGSPSSQVHLFLFSSSPWLLLLVFVSFFFLIFLHHLHIANVLVLERLFLPAPDQVPRSVLVSVRERICSISQKPLSLMALKSCKWLPSSQHIVLNCSVCSSGGAGGNRQARLISQRWSEPGCSEKI